jgi:hypothetical protein
LTDPFGLAGCADAASQGLLGLCLDASNFEPKKDGEQTIISDPSVDQSARANMSSLETKEDPERFAKFTKDENGSVRFEERGGSTTQDGNNYTGVFTIDKVAVAIGHSHPTKDSNAAPGYDRDTRAGDHTAVNNGRPNYIVSEGVILVLEKSGGQFRVRIIDGTPDRQTTRDINSNLRELQRRSRR